MGTRVYIGRLRAHTGEREIEDFFRGYGKIDTVNMKNGFAFVEFQDRRDAGDAVHELNGKTLDGYRVIVDHARGTRDGGRDDRGGRGYGDRGGGGRGGGYDRRGSPPRRRRTPPQRSEHRLVVKNLSSRVSWQDLKDQFRPVGEVTYADAHTKVKNEGVVEFVREKDMLKAGVDAGEGDPGPRDRAQRREEGEGHAPSQQIRQSICFSIPISIARRAKTKKEHF